MSRPDPREGPYKAYLRNTSSAAVHLRRAGFAGATNNSWAGGYRGVDIPLETSHQVALAAPLPGEWRHWTARITEHPDHPHYEQEGLPGSEDHEFDAHPRDVAKHVQDFLRQPKTMQAMSESMKRNRNLGVQFDR